MKEHDHNHCRQDFDRDIIPLAVIRKLAPDALAAGAFLYIMVVVIRIL